VSFAAGIAFISLAAESPAPNSSDADAIRELRAEVTQLRAEVQTLQQRTKSLESTVAEFEPITNEERVIGS